MTACPSWCVSTDCTGDHWSNPGEVPWMGVTATAWPMGGTPTLTPYPTWGQADSLEPAVCLWVLGSTDGHGVDESIDLTPDEATKLATQMLAAAEAVRRG